jgi:hypothetical protein
MIPIVPTTGATVGGITEFGGSVLGAFGIGGEAKNVQRAKENRAILRALLPNLYNDGGGVENLKDLKNELKKTSAFPTSLAPTEKTILVDVVRDLQFGNGAAYYDARSEYKTNTPALAKLMRIIAADAGVPVSTQLQSLGLPTPTQPGLLDRLRMGASATIADDMANKMAAGVGAGGSTEFGQLVQGKIMANKAGEIMAGPGGKIGILIFAGLVVGVVLKKVLKK